MLQLLLAKDADPNAVNPDTQQSVLSVVCSQRSADCMQVVTWLLDAGASAETPLLETVEEEAREFSDPLTELLCNRICRSLDKAVPILQQALMITVNKLREWSCCALLRCTGFDWRSCLATMSTTHQILHAACFPAKDSISSTERATQHQVLKHLLKHGALVDEMSEQVSVAICYPLTGVGSVLCVSD